MKAVRQWLFAAEAVNDKKSIVDEPDVYPVHSLDRMAEYQKFVATVMYFNDALDADMLNASLVKLLETGDWKKLGGRLKKDVNGRLQLHVPPRFSAEQPAVAYTHECLTEMKISDHPVAKSLPTHTHVPSLQPLPERGALRTLQVRPDFPASLDDLMAEDLPPLSLHVHTFQDATVVGLSWPHLLMDGVGRSALMKSWSLVMAGQEDKVPPVAGAHHDVLSGLPAGASDQDEFFANKGLLRGVRLAKVLLYWGWAKLAGPGKVIRSMYLPKEIYDMLVGGIKEQVSQVQGQTGTKRYISESDAITAWVTRQVALSEPRPRPVTIMSLFNGRYALKQHLNPDAVYLQNMVLINYTTLSAEEARDAVAPLALACKAQLSEQTSESRALGFIQWISKRVDKTKHTVPLCGGEDSVLLCCNSLIRADLIRETRFAPAVLRAGEAAETRRNPAGSMINFFYGLPNEPTQFINGFNILGKDHSGGTWFAGNLAPQVWEALEYEVKQLGEGKSSS
ncbi:hypothetical protein LMH87_012296 [Akanthomyces muscarius]|uniref:Uncharacterized protein n=1 Tax=Akanthomyces muscarius TaxID=2231603 RepID=A0A9W8QCF0_AKAMU|nr:hypothetical protein LMH87_012296 [Akanthomyces muscarius]KAJ4151606.1 hypothetical protein LMH87_012296 [Akanthomyces muscarius]